MHFSRARKKHNLKASINKQGYHTTPPSSLRILGIYFDPKLTWGAHVKKTQYKASTQIQSLRRLTQSTWGATFHKAKLLYSKIPAKSISSPPRGAGVNAQYALHIWGSQEDSHNPSLQDPHSSLRVSIVFVSTSLSPQHLFYEAPNDWPREYIVKGSILSQRTPDESKLLAQMVGCWLDFLEVVG
ncbi:hypothetical protein EV44_g3358 [Erysiphe necator]|uniref:Uncharacterized protein n=1 Tax=Uncinula necator TaxID=52586 RepID=A0A0B1NYR7_UNCNE|nr:hypothetical protein EV44_g3358 [Erysiphe necator]